MSLASCMKCWDDICTCGYKYEGLSEAARMQVASAALGITVEALREALEMPSVRLNTRNKRI